MGLFDDILKDNSPEETGQEELEEKEGPEKGQPSETNEEEEKEEQKTEEEKAEELLLGKFKTPDDLAKAYKELEKKLGSRDEEKEKLRQENELAKQQLAQVVQYLQMLQTQGQGPQAVQGQSTLPKPEPVDPDKWLEKFYAQGPRAVEELIEAKLQEQGALLGQTLNQILTPIAQYIAEDMKEKTQRQYVEKFNSEATQLKEKYSDFEDVKQTMIELYDKDPKLALVPMETVYYMAKAQIGQQAGVQVSKQAAKMPGSTGKVVGKKKPSEEEELDRIFGREEGPKGIFG